MGWNLDWLLGPREWLVVDDGGQSVDPIYPIIAPRRLNSDRVLASGLRRREAFRMAERLSRTPNPQQGGR